jgi:hypothetical protein
MNDYGQRDFQLEGFKQQVITDSKYGSNTSNLLEHTINQIYNHNASGLNSEEFFRFFS